MKDFRNIIYEKDCAVAKITVNRPPFNILNVETLREIATALEDVEKDNSIKVLVITGAGKKCSRLAVLMVMACLSLLCSW